MLGAAAAALASPTLFVSFSDSTITLQSLGTTPRTCTTPQPRTDLNHCKDTTAVFTLNVPAGDLATTVSFTETLPSGLRVSNPVVKGGTCTNAGTATAAAGGGTTITVTGVQVPAGGAGGASCEIWVDVTAAAGARNGSCPNPGGPPAFTTITAAGVPPAGNISGASAGLGLSGAEACVTVGTWPADMTPADRAGVTGNQKLNCTANDTGLTNVNITAASTCIAGQDVSLSITSDLNATATARYNVGIFIAPTGDFTKASGNAAGVKVSSASILNQGVSPPAVIDADGNACLDLTSAASPTLAYPIGTFTIKCVPDPVSGLVTLQTITTWENSGDVCQSVQDTFPQTSSKCATGTTPTTVAVQGAITIRKVVVGVDQPFNFTAANSTTPGTPPTPTNFALSNGQFQLVATAPLKQAGENYVINEPAVAGFSTSVACKDGTGATVGPNGPNVFITGGTITANMSTTFTIIDCTYTNTKLPTITLNKAVSPTTDPGLFNLTVGGTTVNNQGNGGTTGQVVVTPSVSTTVSEAGGTGTLLSNYTSAYACVDAATQTPITSGSGTSFGVTVLPAQDVICTFTNTRNPSVTVVKALVPVNDPGVFNLNAGGVQALNQPNGGSVTNNAVTNGTPVLVQETAGNATSLANYSSSYSCNDEANSSGAGTQVNVTTTANVPVVTCTFTNTRLTNTVTLNKTLNPGTDGGTFNLIINGATVATGGNGASGSVLNVPVGSVVSISETGAAGTNLVNYTTAVACAPAAVTPGANNQSGTFTMPNAPVTCGFTNTRKQIALTLQKQWANAALNDQVTITAGTHQFISVAGSPNELDTDQPFGVDAGSTISITEAFDVGASASYGQALQCSATAVPLSGSNLTVSAGDAPITCTFTNTLLVQPGITKSFNPTSILSGGTTVLTFTIANPPTGTTRTVTFTDNLPSGLQLANGTVGGTCAGYTITDAANAALAGGSTSVKVTNLTINANQTCTITVNVTNKLVPQPQLNTDCTGNPAAFTNSNTSVTNLTNLDNLILPSCVIVSTLPTLTKVFSPTTINVGGTTVLTFTVDNTQAGSLARTGITFSDALPSSLVLANATVGGTCAGYTITDSANAPLAAGSASVKVTNLSIAQNASCTITVNVTNVPQQVNPACGTPPAFTNAAGSISGINNIVNGVQPSCVVVNPLLPTFVKSFNPTTISVGGTTTLTFTVTNPAVNPALSNVGFVDALPAGLQIQNPPAVGGTCANAAAATTAAAGGNTITVANLQVPAGPASCTVTVNVTNVPLQVNPSCNGNPPNFTNAAGNVTSTTVDNQALPSCVVVNPLTPSLNKAFAPTTIQVGGTTTLTFTITNPAVNNPAQQVSFTDSLPAGLQVAAIPNVGGTCSNAVAATTAAANTGTITVSNVTVPASSASASNCTVTVDVTNVPLQAGNCPAANFTNTFNNISQTINVTNNVTDSCVNVTELTPSLAKSFNPTTINIGGTTTLTFTITNPATNNPAQTFSFVDTLPAGLLVAAVPNIGGTCTGGLVTATGGTNTITLAGIVVPASGASSSSCTVTVDVTNAPLQTNIACPNAPNFTNSAGNLSGVVNVNTTSVVPSCVNVLPLVPTLTKSFSPTTINLGGTTTLTFTVTNPASNPALSNVGFVDTLPSGLIVQTPNGVGGTCANAAAATTATAGSNTITVANLQVAAGASSCTVTVNITNAPGQANPSCANNPVGFTNTAANVQVTNVQNGINPSCVVVNTFSFSITKTPSVSIAPPGSPLSFTIVITNNGPAPADGSIITDPAIANYTVNDPVVCVGTTGGATCPTPLTVAALQGSGMTVATFPAGATITLRIDGTSTLTSGSLINTVTVSPPAGIPGVASASASAVVGVVIGVIPTLSLGSLIVLMLTLAGLAAVVYRRRATE